MLYYLNASRIPPGLEKWIGEKASLHFYVSFLIGGSVWISWYGWSFSVRWFWSESCEDDTLCHVLNARLLFTFRHGNRMWVRVWLPSLASLRIRIVSAEMLGGVFEGLRVPWKRPGGTLGASWAILEASCESCWFSNDLKPSWRGRGSVLEGLGVVLDASGRRLEGVLERPWNDFFSLWSVFEAYC